MPQLGGRNGGNRFQYARLDEAVAAYRALGYCVISDMVSQEECDVMYSLLAETQAQADRGEGDARWLADATAWDCDAAGRRIVRRVPKPFQREERFRAIFGRSAVLDLVEAFVGPEIYLHSSKMIYKPPRVGREKPMHQDLAYWPELAAAQVTLWCPAGPASADNGCIELLPGEHGSEVLLHADLDDWQIVPELVKDKHSVVVEMAAGELLFLHPRIPHASRANVSDEGRLAAVVNFYSQAVSSDGHPYGSAIPLRSRRPATDG